ncbi:hypothetical protein FHS14_003056 [Paenibacillus baekrokdamisoli]|nr:hypothetical protein [Paenibacillus baekrokdamisoli]
MPSNDVHMRFFANHGRGPFGKEAKATPLPVRAACARKSARCGYPLGLDRQGD